MVKTIYWKIYFITIKSNKRFLHPLNKWATVWTMANMTIATAVILWNRICWSRGRIADSLVIRKNVILCLNINTSTHIQLKFRHNPPPRAIWKPAQIKYFNKYCDQKQTLCFISTLFTTRNSAWNLKTVIKLLTSIFNKEKKHKDTKTYST